jgi:hypothetical protein
MQVNDIFDIDEKGLPVLKPIARTIRSFANVIKKNNKKHGYQTDINDKELAFIYYYCNKNMFNGYLAKQRFRTIVRRLGLPDNWEADEEVTIAINDLLDDSETSVEKSLRVVQESLLRFVDVLDEIGSRNDARLNELRNIPPSSLDATQEVQRKLILSELEVDLGKLLDYQIKLPKAIDQIEILEAKVKKQVSTDKNVGKKTSNKWEDD